MKEQFLKKVLEGDISLTLDATRRWKTKKEELISHIERITEDYAAQGFRLTLRQLYYQLVAGEFIPNHDKVYKKLSAVLDDCRYGGLVDWATIIDRGRQPKQAYYENSVEGALRNTLRSYYLDRQKGQPIHLEVWTEKDAISEIIERACNPYTIVMAVNKGYTSSTAIHATYERYVRMLNNKQQIKILYFGDHDPSGLDMIRDIRDRLTLMFYAGEQLDNDVVGEWLSGDTYQTEDETYKDEIWEKYKGDKECTVKYKGDQTVYFDGKKAFIKEFFEVIPIGLTMEQIKQYNPPHNPAKITDPRAAWYIKQHGQKSWEVDALSPTVTMQIIQTYLDKYMDADVYNKLLLEEEKDRENLKKLIDIANNPTPPKAPRKPRKPAAPKKKATPKKKAPKKKPVKKKPAKKAAIKKPRKPRK